MLTPEEVASHAFARATFGGYNMMMVDEFLDELTEDYTSLYKENAVLKTKMKILKTIVTNQARYLLNSLSTTRVSFLYILQNFQATDLRSE